MADLMAFVVERPEEGKVDSEEKVEEPETFPDSTEPEEEPEPVSSTSNIDLLMDETAQPAQPQPSPTIIESPPAEESSKDVSDSEEKPVQPEPSSETMAPSSHQLTSFPARWMKNHGIDQRIIDLVYWQEIKKTAIVFSTLLVVLISLSCCSLLSVITFFSMAVLTVALLYRVGMTVMGAIQKSGTENPFKTLLDKEIEIPKEKAVEMAESLAEHINCLTKSLRRLFLVEDIVDSIKFGVMLWVLSYVGAWFSMLTLIIFAVVMVFSLPKVYEEYQDKIDEHVKVIHSQVSTIIEQAKSKLPEKLRPKEKTT